MNGSLTSNKESLQELKNSMVENYAKLTEKLTAAERLIATKWTAHNDRNAW